MGDLIAPTAGKTPQVVIIKQHPIDDILGGRKGTIERPFNTQFCRHAVGGMCEYCLPLQPFDSSYHIEHEIKHLSFHSYLKQLLDRAGNNATSYLSQLDKPRYSVLHPCPSGHAPYPASICSACQPTAITLQRQTYRMVDHVEFESPGLVDTFLSRWRGSGGKQRIGFLYGNLEVYENVPLGIKIVVKAIYEPKQEDGSDFIQTDLEERLEVTELGLELVGMIVTDLQDAGEGKVVYKRHADSYFVAGSEVMTMATLQMKDQVKSKLAREGTFGSRFVTVIVSGDDQGQVELRTYQTSNVAMQMVAEGLIEASTDPALLRVVPSSSKYVPDVFFKYKNEYGLMVQEKANPTFPVEYLLVTVISLFNPYSLLTVSLKRRLLHS